MKKGVGNKKNTEVAKHFHANHRNCKICMPIYLFPPSTECYGKITIEIMGLNAYCITHKRKNSQFSYEDF